MPTYRELNLPQEVLDKIKERCKEQGSIFNIDSDSHANNDAGGFDWSDSIEYKTYQLMWAYILNHNNTCKEFQQGMKWFYDLYPNKSIELISEEPRTYKAKLKGKLYEITIKKIEYEN